MKQHQLVNSFFLASTTVVLVTQPVWADTVKVKAVRLVPTASGIEVILETSSKTLPPVFTASDGQTLIADIIDTRLHLPKGKTFRAANPTDKIRDVTVTPLNANSIRVSITGTAGLPISTVLPSNQGLIFNITATNTALNQSQSRLVKSDQSSSLLATAKQKLLEAQRSDSARNLSSSKTKAQATPSAAATPTHNVTHPNHVGSYPSYLNPSPNPLQFPTRPSEVRIQGTQPITLEQAYAIARRNNRDLQVAELTLERSKDALRQAQAALYPTINLSASVQNSGNAFINGSSSSGSFGSLSSAGSAAASTTGTGVGGTGTSISTPNVGNLTGSPTNGVTNANTNATPVTQPTGSTINTNPGGTTTTTGTGATTTAAAPTTTTGTGATTGRGATTGTGAVTGTGATTGVPTTNRTTRFSASTLTGTAALNYNLYTSGGRRASIRAAKEQVHLDQLAVEAQAETIRLNVANDYYNLQNADQQVLIQQAAVTNALASLRDAQAQEQAGIGTRFDTLTAQVQLANSTQNLTTAQANQQTARRQLAQLLSISQPVDLSAADPVQIAGLWNLSLEDSIVLAYKNRAELEQQLAQRNIAEQNRRLALSSIGPQVSLGASYNVNDTFATSFPSSGGGFDNYVVGATVSLLLFDGGAARANAAQQEANKAIAEVGFANIRNQIRFNVEHDYANLQANFANIQTTTLALEQSREALRLARLRFQAGVGTQTDVINAENNLTSAEGNRVAAILNYNISLASLQRDISSGQIR